MAALRKSIGFSLILSLLFVMLSAFAVNSAAADVTVNIVSFTRGAQEDLRSSELLEARVEGYDGNVRELTYKWTSTLGTYLYVYNNHNMYGINNTDGEIEIYNSDKRVSSSSNMSGRSYNKTFSGTGYAWAAIYGANVSSEDFVGVISVEVYDADGNLLASDSHEGTRERTGGSWWRPSYVSKGIVESDLDDDVGHVRFGLFEGDTKNVKILLGESSIVHITCVECTISDPQVTQGEGIIELEVDKDTNEWHIKSVTGTSYGDAKVEITITKGNCKFHQNYEVTREIEVYVYKKPTTTSTATTIMLDNLDEHCTYYIGGVMGERQTVDGKEYVVFENLTPNTQYQIEVVGQAEDTEPVYAYVYETTKPAHIGTVKVFLNGTYDTSTATATGTLVNIEDMMPEVETLYLRYEDSEIYFPLVSDETGVYYSELSDGNYTLYYSASGSDEKVKLGDQILTINGASRTRDLFFNSVTYDANGGEVDIPVAYYLVNSKVMVSDMIPTKEGYLFTHWICQSGHEHKAGDVLSEAIGEEYSLVAQYVESFDVYANIIIKHICADGENHNNDKGMHDITFTVDRRFGSSGDFTELVSHTVEWDGISEYEGDDYVAEYVNIEGEHKDRTLYTAKTPVLVNVEKDAEYTFTTVKSGYDLESVVSEMNEDGDLVLTATLIFDPNDFDFTFTVELDEKSMKVDDSLKPAAVNVKVICWGDPVDIEGEDVMWWHIIQQHDTYERIALDEDGKGVGTFPVWMATTDETQTPYSYRIEVVSYETKDGTIIEAIDKDDAHEIYHTPKNRFSTEIFVEGGNTPVGSTLDGAYYDADAGEQVGTVNGVITIEVFDVIFDPNGGVLNGEEGVTVLNYQVGIPKLDDYVPTREGGYKFDGWYLADENGEITDEVAVSDTIIFEDTTLVAKWKEPLTIKGQVAVAGTYSVVEDGVQTVHVIPDHDRLPAVYVFLQRIDANGYAETVNYMQIPVAYDETYGIGEYEFTGIEDSGFDYRIKVTMHDYHSHYNNDSSGISFDAYEDYAEESEAPLYIAEFVSEDLKTANVYAYLHFMPETFELKYEIYSDYIGEGFKPTDAEVLVLCDTGEHLDPQHWTPISQMIHGDEFYGNLSDFEGGVAYGSEAVWEIQASSGKSYDYSIRVDSLTILEQEISYSDYEWPFYITYNGSARYSDITKEQTQLLTATLVPRMYTVTFDMGNLAESAIVEGMDEYATVEQTFVDEYYWSHGTAITAVPEAEGYTFLGWVDEEGNKVTSVSADSAENITVYANWITEVEFETMADAGYYSETRDAEEKIGTIAFSARITNFEEVKSRISSYGMYLYNASSTFKASVDSGDITSLEASEGAFHAYVVNIAKENFDGNILAIPYVIVDGELIMGEAISMSVSAKNKWLEPEN